MTKTEDSIATLKYLIKHLEEGHEVMNFKVVATAGEVLTLSLDGPEFARNVVIRLEYKKAAQ